MKKKWFEKKVDEEKFDPRPEETNEMPVVPYRVLHANIPFFSDAECRNQIADATLAILKPLDPDDQMGGLDVVPVRKNYSAGQLVGWHLDHKQVWEECWYHDPNDGQIQIAWNLHVEFTGPVISQQAIEAHRERLDEIERRMASQGPTDPAKIPTIH